MTAHHVAILVFTSVALFVGALLSIVYHVFFRRRLMIQERMDSIKRPSEPRVSGSPLFKDKTVFRADDKPRWLSDGLLSLIEQSGLEITTGQLLAYSGGIGLLVAVAVYIATWMSMLLPIAFVTGALTPFAYLYGARHVRMMRLCRQLPQAFDVINRAVRAGQTVQSAMQIVADDFDPPISLEFRRCSESQNLRLAPELALREMANRTGVMELRLFVVGLRIQSQSGGNLLELLGNLASMVRKRLRMKERVKALTGEGRAQANILSVLPVLAFVGIQVLAPKYAETLLEHPWILVGTAAAQIVGMIWIRRIVGSTAE